MWTPSDFARRSAKPRPSLLAPLALLAAIALLVPAALPTALSAAESRASKASSSGTSGLTPERAQLRQTILGLYEVLPMRGGLLLKPRASKVGVRTIELTDGSIAINGETTPPSVVRAWLVGDAPPVLQLSELPPAERRQLFGLPAEGSAAPAPLAATSTTSTTSATSAASAASATKTAGAEVPKPPAEDNSEEKSEETETSDVPTPPEPPEAPEPPSPPTSVSAGPKVRVGGSQRVEANEVAESVVAVGGQVHVDGEVERDVAAIGGSAWINGKVGGGVTSVGGSVHLGPKAEVEGDVTSVLGHIHADPQAKVHGAKTEVSPGDMMTGGRHGRNGNVHIGPFSGTSSFVWTMMQLFLKVFLVCLTLLVARPRIERLERRLIAQPWESGGVGLLTVVGFVPALVLATLLTCCLFLILYPVVFVVLFLVWLLGYTTVVSRIGRWAEGRFGWSFGGNPYFAALLGMVLIESLRIVGSFVGIGDGVFTIFGALLGGTGRVIVVVATIFGIGVVLLDRFSGGWRRTPPAPSFVEPDPPMPPAPPAPPAPPRETWESEPLP